MSAPQLSRYEIINELGQGGMSVVYRARDKQLSRDVALKVLHDFLARQTEARRRFHREAVAVAKLHHPGILEIFDYSGPSAEQSYIVTELIEGVTLRDFVEKHNKPRFPELGVLVAAELVRALRHAHEQGVVHRDLKPENIMITRTGQLKLMDFGIAQIMGGATKLTATGTLLGSPAHMAPEVIDGQASDHRSDIFSLGTILYWLTTGELPFAAPNPSALFRRILEGHYDPAQILEPKIGNKLSRTIDRALALDPEDRYQDISELEADLNAEMLEVGLDPPESKVKAFLVAPNKFADEFESTLIEKLAAVGEEALAKNEVARAMDRFNRVLAVDPHHERVKALVARVGRRERLTRGARRAAVFVFGSLAIGGAAYGAVELYPRLAPEEPPKTAVLAAVAKPATISAAKPAPVQEPATAPNAESAAEPEAPKAPVKRRRVRASDAAKPKGMDARRGSALTATPRAVKTAAAEAIREAPPSAVPPVAESVVTKKLTIKISTWADIWIDGKKHGGLPGGTFELGVGDHEVEVVFPGIGDIRAGRFEKRRFHVDEHGELFEYRSGGLVASPDVLQFVIPQTPEQGAKTEGWTWS